YENPKKRIGVPNHDNVWGYLIYMLSLVEQGKVDFIDESFKLNDEISLYPIPGHTPGQVAIVVKSKGERAIIVGDLLSSALQLTQVDVSIGWDSDPALSTQSRKKVFAELADTNTILFATHVPGGGHLVVKDGGGYRLK
ncbi:MAG TPA: MBL fold metallo-hydrolase, partial [Syntrophomonas sp.]|nr:MBL fold metallo-hydrolase [Syntrophomonas sp.]